MKIEISDVRDGARYVVENASECKTLTDRSAFQEVLRSGEVICMGTVVARPIE